MAAMVTYLSWWSWSGKTQESSTTTTTTTTITTKISNALGSIEVENKKKLSSKVKMPLKRVKQKWHSREERRIDKEYDAVLVPSDGGCCISESDSDDSDWSVGWVEPHAPDFNASDDDEFDGSFAVLVPCYSHARKRRVDSPANEYSYSPGQVRNGFLEQWLASV